MKTRDTFPSLWSTHRACEANRDSLSLLLFGGRAREKTRGSLPLLLSRGRAWGKIRDGLPLLSCGERVWEKRRGSSPPLSSRRRAFRKIRDNFPLLRLGERQRDLPKNVFLSGCLQCRGLPTTHPSRGTGLDTGAPCSIGTRPTWGRIPMHPFRGTGLWTPALPSRFWLSVSPLGLWLPVGPLGLWFPVDPLGFWLPVGLFIARPSRGPRRGAHPGRPRGEGPSCSPQGLSLGTRGDTRE